MFQSIFVNDQLTMPSQIWRHQFFNFLKERVQRKIHILMSKCVCVLDKIFYVLPEK